MVTKSSLSVKINNNKYTVQIKQIKNKQLNVTYEVVVSDKPTENKPTVFVECVELSFKQ